MPKGGDRLIKITELANETAYTAEYLSLRARQGKLKAQKVGNVWYTTVDSLNEYRDTQEIKKIDTFEKLSHFFLKTPLASTARPPAGRVGGRDSLPDGIVSHARLPDGQARSMHRSHDSSWFLRWVAIPLALVILFGFIPIEALHQSFVLSMGILNDLSDDSNRSIREELRGTIGVAPQMPRFFGNFITYSRTMMLGLGQSIGQPLSAFYNNHPLLLAASESNFAEMKDQIATKYGPTSETAISLALKVISRIPVRSQPVCGVGTRPDGVCQEGKVAGLKTARARTIPINGDVGTFSLGKGEQSVVLVSQTDLGHFSIMPSRAIVQYEPSLERLNDYQVVLELSQPAEQDLEVLWRKL